MSDKVKKTRPELLKQRQKLSMFERFLPTLVLKKQQLQSEILKVRTERARLDKKLEKMISSASDWSALFSESLPGLLPRLIKVGSIVRGVKNVAGIKLPIVTEVEYEIGDYSLLFTAPWMDKGLKFLKELMELREHVRIMHEQEKVLQMELRKITQRVNLFEKVMIPQAREHIRQIRIALAEEQTAAVGRSKIAKGKSAA